MALKICTKSWNSSYEENLAIVSLTSLAQRRDHLSLCYLYKLVNNLFCFPEAPLIPYTHTKFTRAGSFVQPFAKIILILFFPRTINKWNNLPVTVQMSHSFYTFTILVKALEDKTMEMNSLADKIRAELGMLTPLNIRAIHCVQLIIIIRQLVTVP